MYDTVCRLVTDPGSSTELITLKPWSTGKQLPLGFSVFGQKEIMKWTTLTFKELAAQKTLRMDAGYWIKKKKKEAASCKRQATSDKRLTDSNK